MVNKYYQKRKKSEKKYGKGIKVFLSKKKRKDQKRPKKDIKILLKNKKKKEHQYY